MGFINRVFADDELDGGLKILVDELLGKSGAVLRLTLKGLRELSLGIFRGIATVRTDLLRRTFKDRRCRGRRAGFFAETDATLAPSLKRQRPPR